MLVALFALLLLSAIGMGMMFSANMETMIDANYRDKQIAIYASLSGLQEARDRIYPGISNGDSIALPTALPTASNGNVIYILNPRTSSDTVAPWNINSRYPDTELCHENVLSLTGTPDTPCTTIPSGSSWYTTVNNNSSSYTGAYCSAGMSCHCPAGGCILKQPLAYKWTRISLKADNMVPMQVSGASSSGRQVCWNGTNQIPLPGGYGPSCGPNGSIYLVPDSSPSLPLPSANQGSGYTSTPTVTITAPPAGGTQATATATVTLSPTGALSGLSITSAGTGYATAPTVSFVGGGGSGAAATAVVGAGGAPVASVNLNVPGTACYGGASAPTVNLAGGGGSGATATATLGSATCIYSINLSGSCSAKKGQSGVSFTVNGGGGSGFTGTVDFKNGNGSVVGTHIATPGSGFSSVPTSATVSGCPSLTVSGALGRNVQSLAGGGGSGYTTAPTVTVAGAVSPGTGTTPTGTATLGAVPGNAGTIIQLNLTNAGTGYTTAPSVVFTGGGGSGASAVASLAQTGKVTSITLTNPGSGYLANPAVTIAGGGGSGANVLGRVASGPYYGQVLLITSFAQTPSGTRAMSQMEVATSVTGFPFNLTGALTFAGFHPTFGSPNSNNFHVYGADANSCGETPEPEHPSVGVYDDPKHPTTPTSAATILAALARPDHYVGGQDHTAPDVENVFGALGTAMTTPGGLNAFAEAVRAVAHANGTEYSSGSSIELGISGDPTIAFVNGDVSLSGNNHGYGILLVTGTLNMGGNFSWNGPILVIGQGIANFNGGGNGQITGMLFVAKTRDASGNLLDLHDPLVPLGAPTIDWSGGGGNGIQYDHCWATNMLKKIPFTPPPTSDPIKVLSTRTVTY